MASIVEQVFDCIKNKESFVLDAGAGSGKTWTLVQALNFVIESKSKELKNNGQKIVCITYTNIAKDEIIERTEHNELILVSTIHEFLWECIKKFQSELKIKFIEILEEKLIKEQDTLSKFTTRAKIGIKKSESKIARYKEAIESLNTNTRIKINYGNYSNYKKGQFDHDILIVIAEKIFSSYPKIRKIITDTYPIIFVDEYQDTQRKTVIILLNYLRGKPDFTLGFFGDKRQQIYDTGIGEIPAEYNLKLIQKTENYRSSKEVVGLLNKIRSDIQQYQPPSNTRRGEILFFHKLDATGFIAKNFIEQYLKDRWRLDSADKVKILYLTHRSISEENKYVELYNVHSNPDVLTRNKDNRGISPFTDFLFNIEEIVALYNEKRIQKLLNNISYEVRTFDSKKNLNELLEILIGIRTTKTIKEVIDFVVNNKILAPTEKMKYYDLEDEDNKIYYNTLMKLDYSQFVRLYQVQQDNTPFSTKHNTKGDEFNNVVVIIDDNSWVQKYNFNDYFSDNLVNAQRNYRTSNLFYVVCSRAKNNLAIICISPLSNEAKSRIKDWFQDTNYVEINT